MSTRGLNPDPTSTPGPTPSPGGPVGGRLDLVEGVHTSPAPASNAPSNRPFLQVFFKCANQYLRVNRSADGSGYRAMCPLCGKRVNFVVGPGGTSERYFELSC
ncbi:MAG TPA: hypothetical protein VK176_15695 [Phycisphaerales bacterium]|nr:hypothetical protein [Phycisphaerales bacterium]